MYLHGGCNNVGVAMEMNFGQLHLSANSHEEQPSVIYCLERVLLASVLCQRPVPVSCASVGIADNLLLMYAYSCSKCKWWCHGVRELV